MERGAVSMLVFLPAEELYQSHAEVQSHNIGLSGLLFYLF